MSDCADFTYIVDYFALTGSQHLYDLHERFFVRREVHLILKLLLADLMGDESARTDSFTVALCDYAFILHVDQLIFKRGAAGIDD